MIQLLATVTGLQPFLPLQKENLSLISTHVVYGDNPGEVSSLPIEADLLNMRHFEDFRPGEETTVGDYLVTEDELIDFAKKWDPQPFHVDKEAAGESVFGGLIACGCHVVSISILLQNEVGTRPNIIAGLGWDQLRFPKPVRPGDRLSLTVVCLEKRELRSRSEQGIVRNLVTVTNQQGEPVLTYQDTIIVAKRVHQLG